LIEARGTWTTAVLVLASAALAVLAGAALYQVSFYVRLPVDLLSFAESPFIADIVSLRLGESPYHPPGDNNSYPYSAGTQVLTHAIARLLGRGDSIATMRWIQLAYVLAACVVGVGICHEIARRALGRYRHRALWWVVWGATLVLVALDPRFNAYNHSLHNDGLGLLVSALAFWTIARYERTPRRWLMGLSLLIPVAGFLVKQSLIIWLGLAAACYLLTGRFRLRHAALFVAAGGLAAAGAVAVQHALWGDPYLWWVFGALGAKTVSPFRSALHGLEAGGYLVLAAVGAWALLLRPSRGATGGAGGAASGVGARARDDGTPPAGGGAPRSDASAARRPRIPRLPALVALWGVWLVLFLGEAYTSGLGWVVNHLGPGVFLATCWFLVAVTALWRDAVERHAGWAALARTAILGAVLVCVPGALDLVRVPRNPVPADFDRYVSAIEAAFEGLPASDVLLDNGSWIYLREGVIMKDRSSVVGIHAGPNQEEISREHLADTIDRIRSRRYAKILTRELYSERSPYDFQNRGSGVREAILESYREVGRIPAVEGIDVWWPRNLLSEIIVLEPRE